MAKSKQRKKPDPAAEEKEKIHRAINRIRKGLKWQVKIEKSNRNCRILSDHSKRVHNIELGKQDPTHGLDLLHELCHAHLHDHYHPFFSTQIFAIGTEKQQIQDTAPVLNLALDWFVEELEHTLVPQLFEKEVNFFAEKLIQFQYHRHQRSVIENCEEALLIAQSQRYLQLSIPVDGVRSDLVRELLKSDPSQPSIENLITLMNDLLFILRENLGRTIQVETLQDGDRSNEAKR